MPKPSKPIKTTLNKIFRIQYASNLNVHNLAGWEARTLIKPSAPYLALLGDIGSYDNLKTRDFLKYCEDEFERVYWIPGAVELSSTDTKQVPWNFQLDKSFELIKKSGLKRTTIGMKYTENVNGVNLILTTLWGKEMIKKGNLFLNNLQGSNNRMNNENASILFHNEANWLATQIYKQKTPIVCLTYSNSEMLYRMFPAFYPAAGIHCHLEGATTDGSSRTYTGGFQPWVGINMAGHQGYSNSQVLEIKIPVEMI